MADNHNNNKKNEGIFDDAESDMDTNSTGSNDHKNSNKNSNGSDDDEDLFAPSSSEPSPSSSKKKTTSNNKNNATDRLAGLSKFVRRILDPNREPRGLIEPPQVIPLNDEFLQAFGKREQEFDRQLGRDANFDQTIPDDDDDEGEGEDAKRNKKRKRSQENEEDEEGDTNKPTKVKVSNLLYTTTEETLAEECRNFGPVLEVNMIMDDNNPEKNVGRAYVVFADERSAQACVDQQLGGDLNGRPIRVALAENLPKKSASNPTAGGARYYQKDISTKCFRCGKIGHIGANCPNPPKANICPLCAKVDEHDMRACPWNRVCFNCGIPVRLS